MKIKNTIFALLALMLVGIVATAGASAFGWMSEDREDVRQAIEDNDFEAWRTAKQTRITEENFNEVVSRHESGSLCRESHDEVREAIDNENYQDYLDAVTNYDSCPKEMPELSEEDFEILVQIHDARQEGDFEAAHELMEDLDVDMSFGNGQGMGKGLKGEGMHGMQKGMRGQGFGRSLE